MIPLTWSAKLPSIENTNNIIPNGSLPQYIPAIYYILETLEYQEHVSVEIVFYLQVLLFNISDLFFHSHRANFSAILVTRMIFYKIDFDI